MHRDPRITRPARGFAYMEVIIATVILALIIPPALDALNSGVASNRHTIADGQRQLKLVGRYEELMTGPYATLDAAQAGKATPSALSDPPGTPDRVLVYIAGWDADDADADGDPNTGVDPDILWMRLEIENTPLNIDTLVVP